MQIQKIGLHKQDNLIRIAGTTEIEITCRLGWSKCFIVGYSFPHRMGFLSPIVNTLIWYNFNSH